MTEREKLPPDEKPDKLPRHEMTLVMSTKDYDEWLCKECGRRVSIRGIIPRVLKRGNRRAIHIGFTAFSTENYIDFDLLEDDDDSTNR